MGKHSQCKTCRSINIKKLKYKRINYGEIECTSHKTIFRIYRDSKLSLEFKIAATMSENI